MIVLLEYLGDFYWSIFYTSNADLVLVVQPLAYIPWLYLRRLGWVYDYLVTMLGPIIFSTLPSNVQMWRSLASQAPLPLDPTLYAAFLYSARNWLDPSLH